MNDFSSRETRAGAGAAIRVCGLLLVLALFGASTVATAQQTVGGSIPTAPAVSSASALPTAADAAAADESAMSYRIGIGDVLDIRVFNRPQLSREAVRVDGRGTIRMPLIEGEIQASCRTEEELAREIAKRYLKYQRSPQVDVYVKEYQSQPVAVIGAVNQPGRFQLQRRVRLLELLAFAGGPNNRGGQRIQVVHTATVVNCEAPEAAATTVPAAKTPGDEEAPGEDVQNFTSYNLNETLRGDDQANPYVRPGDIITLPEAEQVYIIGNVLRPAALSLKEPITVSQAIAMVGGSLPDTKSNRIRILRQVPGSTTKTELVVDLDAIKKRRAEDVALMPNDIVDVPTSTGKRLLRSIVGVIAPTLTQLPVRVVN
jgi:polysaccharide export outer membrane protein